MHLRGKGARSASVQHILYIIVQHRQIGEEDDCSTLYAFMCVCTDACMYMCAFCLVHVHAYTIDHTTHSPDDSLCFLYTRQFKECKEHHHLTEQSDLNGLLHLCQSLQDHLKY